ncbi:MAG: STAS domain-containing protein [Phycisphaerales bacterium]|jgi:anti-sigma B factor antagonist|nr:STAS domain-containing protein [Phycisphaerales bacterium]
MNSAYILQQIGQYTVVEFRIASLMDPSQLQQIGDELYPLVDQQDKRLIVLDFEPVQYLSSQAIGIVLTLHKKLNAIGGKLILCGVGARLMELLRITRLDRLLTIKPTQKEVININTVK